ncbi:hypothetical protein TNCV_1782281 [Trichonephila clavipes]|nr:hypothetical protein TNCV_1782281 [Trichonephila clavipes]
MEDNGSGFVSTRMDNATQRLLAMDFVILNHGQVTRTTFELAHPFPNYHTTPTVDAQSPPVKVARKLGGKKPAPMPSLSFDHGSK